MTTPLSVAPRSAGRGPNPILGRGALPAAPARIGAALYVSADEVSV
ncbi:hypothetical protein ACFV0D_09695 [Streptomyces sp. NPDC059556]